MAALTKRRALYWAVCLLIAVAGLALRHASLETGFHGDDSAQIAMADGAFPVHRSVWDLFRFADVENDGRALMDFGYQPWWTSPDLRIAMFRPLSSALIVLDRRLFGTDDVAYHLHSFAWWIALLAAAALLARRLLPLPAAVITVLVFAVDEAHAAPLAWLANRSTLVSTTFGLLGLYCHARATSGPRRWRALEAGAFCLSLAGGEYALSVVAFAVAYEVVRTGEPRAARVRALLPALGPAIAYLVLRAALKFGVRDSGYYISPLRSPLEYATAAWQRIPALVTDLTLSIPARWWVEGSPWLGPVLTWRKWQQFLGLSVAIAGFVALKSFDARLPARERHALRFLALGTLLSLLPSAGALPEDRLLVAAAFGFAAILALVVYAAFRRHWALGAGVAALLAPLHIGRAAERSFQASRHIAWVARAHREWALAAEIPDENAARQRVLILSGADFTTNANLPWVRWLYGHPLPRSYWRLTGTSHVQEIQRLGDKVIDVAVLSSDLDHTMAGTLYRPEDQPLRPGDRVRLDGMTVEVLRVAGKNPWRTRYTFDESLDDARFVFLHSTPRGLERMPLPAVGDKLRLPPPQRPFIRRKRR